MGKRKRWSISSFDRPSTGCLEQWPAIAAQFARSGDTLRSGFKPKVRRELADI
jgi:hypothetical protein